LRGKRAHHIADPRGGLRVPSTVRRDRRPGADGPAAYGRADMSGMAAGSHYEILVQGVLDEHWTAWFGGLQVSSDSGQTVICGPVTDQAALHGLLTKVHDLGLVLG
jgi:hypothetical protein